jgi:uncharacterized protein involved in outer membrane biogenesis
MQASNTEVRPLRRLVAILLGLAVAAAAAYAALLAWYDGDRIRSVVQERMLTRYGVVLHIDQLERSFSPRPHIRLRGLRVANAAQRDYNLVTIDTASFRFRPLSPIVGSIALDDILIDGVHVTVPVDDEGALYWDPLVAAVSQWLHRFDWSLHGFDVRNLESATRNVRNDNDFLVAARRVSGSMPRPADLTVVATDVQANLETTLPLRLTGTARLKRVELGRQQGDLPVTFTAEGSIGDKALSIEGAGENLLDGDPMERDRLQARVALEDAVAVLQGTMSRDDMKHLDLLVTFDKPGKDGEPPLEAEFNVSDPGTHWRFSNIRSSLGKSELTGYVEIANRGNRRFFGGTLDVTNVHYPEEEEEPEPEGQSLSDVLPEGDLYSNLLDLTEKLDADVRFRAVNSTFLGIMFKELSLRALLEGGKLATAIDKATISDAALAASFSITPDEGETVLELEASLRDAPLSALIAELDALNGVTGQFDGSLKLRATGRKTPSVLDSTTGRLVLFLEDGAMPDKLATQIAGDVFTAMFADFDEDDTIPIHCAIVDFAVENGVARSQQMVLDTDAFNLYGRGEIRLGEQRLDIELEPRAKDFTLVSMRLPLRIHGSFDDISFNPDVSEGVASLLTPVELGREGDSNCAPPGLSAASE